MLPDWCIRTVKLKDKFNTILCYLPRVQDLKIINSKMHINAGNWCMHLSSYLKRAQDNYDNEGIKELLLKRNSNINKSDEGFITKQTNKTKLTRTFLSLKKSNPSFCDDRT